jgi:AcrR family transcriptional regulator
VPETRPVQPGHNRRRDLVQIAYRHIAERGFEGLRVREVALEARLNSATLHYYFPTKEALIRGVVDYLAEEFRVSRVPRPLRDAGTPRDLIRMEFEDISVRFRQNPELVVVLSELLLRAHRDPVIAEMLRALEDGWRGYLVGVLQRGINDGAVRADLDLEVLATAIMAQVKGVGLQSLSESDNTRVDRIALQVAAEVEHWLAGHPPPA